MLAQKDLIIITEPVKARIHISYRAPYSDYIDIILETGTNLEVSPYCDLSEDDLGFRCLEEDTLKFTIKYLLNSEYKDQYYNGIRFSISKENLENKYQIIKNSDLTELDFTKPEDRAIFISQAWELYKKVDSFPRKLKLEFLSIFQLHDDGFITKNEAFNQQHNVMENYFKDLGK